MPGSGMSIGGNDDDENGKLAKATFCSSLPNLQQ